MKMIALVLLAGIAHGQTPKPNPLAHTTAPSIVTASVVIKSNTGTVVKLSDEEYARLQKLRQAVDDAEKEIAAMHGVQLVPILTHKGSNACMEKCDTDAWKSADTYEYRGQFLLINVPQKENPWSETY